MEGASRFLSQDKLPLLHQLYQPPQSIFDCLRTE